MNDQMLQNWRRDFIYTGIESSGVMVSSAKLKLIRIIEIEAIQKFGPSRSRVSRSQLRKWSYFDLLTYKIFLRDQIPSWRKLPIAFGESRLGSPDNTHLPRSLKSDYDYQRNGLPLETKQAYLEIYPAASALDSWRSRALFAGSCQAALATILQTFQRTNRQTCFAFQEEPYWEAIDLIREMNFEVFSGRSRPKGKNGILFYDSSTELHDHEFRLSSYHNWNWLLIDSTCFSQSSPKLKALISQALAKKIPVLLIRSHQKLDSLGMEYGRLGSIVLLWRQDFSQKRKAELKSFWQSIEKSMRLMGTASQLRQWYPFHWNKQFQRINEARNRNLRLMNQQVASSLQGLSDSSLRLVRFEHNYFFLLVTEKNLSSDQLRSHVTVLLKLLEINGICARWVASYGWDFVAITSFPDSTHFFPQVSRGTVFRISVPEMELSHRKILIESLKWWGELLKNEDFY